MSQVHAQARRSKRHALPAALTLLVLLAGLIAACGETPSRSTPVEEPDSEAGTAGDPVADGTLGDGTDIPLDIPLDVPDDEPVFRSAAECGRCHTEIYAEWKQSFHGRAMVDPLFLELSAEIDREECIRCHAPIPLRESDFETPVARSSRREDAVSCLSCHQSGGNVAGPFGGLSGACRPVGDRDQRDGVKMCFPCHNQHDTGNEWLRGPYSPEAPMPRQREAQTCLDCHMPTVDRPLVPGGPVRRGRRHTWPGGHSFQQLVRAAQLDVEVTALDDGGGSRIEVFVTNVGAGHSIPTDARHRSFDTYVKLWNENDDVVLDPLRRQDQARAHMAKFRKFYRGSGKRDTQIPPLERHSTLGEGPGSIEIPGLLRGRGEAWLVYRLTPRDALTKESLLAGEQSDDVDDVMTARIVLRVPFKIGGP